MKCSSSMTMLPFFFARSIPITTMFSPSEVLEVKAISLGLALISCPKRFFRSAWRSLLKSARPGPAPWSRKATPSWIALAAKRPSGCTAPAFR